MMQTLRLQWTVPVIAAAGCLALAARVPATGAVAVAAAVGAAGLLAPAPYRPRPGAVTWMSAVTVGTVAFAAVRAVGGPLPVAFAAVPAAASIVAAVAEEAFFRRMLYGWLERWGPAAAVAVTAVAFAAIHVPMYGVQSAPINLAAGLVFGWQRWVTGGWTAPAFTHAVANLIQMG